MLWKEKFEFGIPVIDEQHKTLVDLIEKAQILISDAEEGIDCYDDISVVLSELESYTVFHFGDEEKLMRKFGFENLEKHQIEHDEFVAKIHDLLDADIDFHQTAVLEEIVEFLLDWVVKHILESDSQYVSVIK